ncbi:MAG: hypothetical protein R3234_02390 [Thermoanaerobaculia bacterium]|nr:hypothetical protein [Thermoanaerobaculia bacterium]
MSYRSLVLATVIFVTLVSSVGVPLRASGPPVRFDGPPRYAGEIGELRRIAGASVDTTAEWLGLEGGGAPLRVILVSEGHRLAREAPGWISGYALADRNTAVLFPGRVVRYPYDSLEELFLHEITHLLTHRAAGGSALPRWFREGVALHAARGWTLSDRRHALAAGLTGGPGNLEELESAFVSGRASSGRAYALAGFLVDELIEDRGSEIVRRILSRVRRGAAFEEAFRDTSGEKLEAWASGVWRRYRIWYRWVPFLTSGATLWLLVTGLAVLAAVRRRHRDAEIKARWEEEERARTEIEARLPGRGEDREDREDWVN